MATSKRKPRAAVPQPANDEQPQQPPISRPAVEEQAERTTAAQSAIDEQPQHPPISQPATGAQLRGPPDRDDRWRRRDG